MSLFYSKYSASIEVKYLLSMTFHQWQSIWRIRTSDKNTKPFWIHILKILFTVDTCTYISGAIQRKHQSALRRPKMKLYIKMLNCRNIYWRHRLVISSMTCFFSGELEKQVSLGSSWVIQRIIIFYLANTSCDKLAFQIVYINHSAVYFFKCA